MPDFLHVSPPAGPSAPGSCRFFAAAPQCPEHRTTSYSWYDSCVGKVQRRCAGKRLLCHFNFKTHKYVDNTSPATQSLKWRECAWKSQTLYFVMPQITSKQINVQQPCRRLSDHIFTIFFLDTWENKTFWDGILAALGDIFTCLYSRTNTCLRLSCQQHTKKR